MLVLLLFGLVVTNYCQAKTIKIIKTVGDTAITNVDLQRAEKLLQIIQPSDSRTKDEILNTMIESRRIIVAFNELASKLAKQSPETLQMLSIKITDLVQQSLPDPETLEKLQDQGIGLLEIATILKTNFCFSFIFQIYNLMSGEVRQKMPLSPSSDFRRQLGRDVIYIREVQYHYNPDSEISKLEATENANKLCTSIKNGESFPPTPSKLVKRDEIEQEIFDLALESEKFSVIGPIARGNSLVVIQIIGKRKTNIIPTAKIIDAIKIPIAASEDSEIVIAIQDLIDSSNDNNLEELVEQLKYHGIPAILIKHAKISEDCDDKDLYECTLSLEDTGQLSEIEIKPSGIYICKLINKRKDIMKPTLPNQEMDSPMRLYHYLAKRFPAIDPNNTKDLIKPDKTTS